MKLYDKKFLIYGNCMIRRFGQPGNTDQNTTSASSFFSYTRSFQRDLQRQLLFNRHHIFLTEKTANFSITS